MEKKQAQSVYSFSYCLWHTSLASHLHQCHTGKVSMCVKKKQKSKSSTGGQCHREGYVGSQAETERWRMGEEEVWGTEREQGEKIKAE